MTTNQADDSYNTSDKQDGRRRIESNGKNPWWGIWIGDWMSEPCLAQCSMAAHGLWINLLLHMALDDESGEVSGTAERLARTYRIGASEFIELITELAETGTADVYNKNNKRLFVNNKTNDQSEWQIDNKTFIIIRNRRMYRKHCKDLDISEKRAEAGRKGMSKRWSADNKPITKSPASQDNKRVSNPLYLSSNSISQSDSDSGSENREEEALDL